MTIAQMEEILHYLRSTAVIVIPGVQGFQGSARFLTSAVGP